ncbi:hypothetical protein CH305_05325 [Rhodococcus sp. 15-649-2-2]|nr:hypothetical protein CH305_05325 [Rhodococcus sp. 15-649-2-2]
MADHRGGRLPRVRKPDRHSAAVSDPGRHRHCRYSVRLLARVRAGVRHHPEHPAVDLQAIRHPQCAGHARRSRGLGAVEHCDGSRPRRVRAGGVHGALDGVLRHRSRHRAAVRGSSGLGDSVCTDFRGGADGHPFLCRSRLHAPSAPGLGAHRCREPNDRRIRRWCNRFGLDADSPERATHRRIGGDAHRTATTRQSGDVMRVLFDGYYWFGGPPAGIVITHEKIAAWRREFPDDVLTVALRRRPSPDEASDLERQGLRWIRTYLPTQPLKNMLELSLRVRLGPYDMAWGSNYSPLLGKSAVFVHDALFQSNPEWFTTIERIYLSPIMIAARAASVLFVSSNTEAARIVQHNPRLAPTAVTGFGISHALLDANPAPPPAADLRPGSFVLSVGRLNTRKNLATTLSAAVHSGAISPSRPFVVVGPANGKADQLEQRVLAAIDDGSIRYTGFVETEHLAWLYRNTALFVYLSLNEGYGLPPLEALRLGAPVLVSERPIFRELLRESVRYCDPTDIDAVAQAMKLSLSDGRLPLASDFEFPSWEHMVHTMRGAMTDTKGKSRRRLTS